MTHDTRGLSRRQALQILGGTGLAGLAGCTSVPGSFAGDDPGADGTGSDVQPRDPPSEPPDATVELTAAPGEISPAPDAAAETWLYDGAFPAEEIRVSEDDVVGVTLNNQLPEETTVHWHGLPVANAMDGVPDVTQAAVEPGDSFDYRFRADPPGTYFFHSHVGLQFDRGLMGPLVVEESDPHVDYDRDYVVLLDDYLAESPRPASEFDRSGDRGSGGPGGGMGGGGPMGGSMNLFRPPYDGMVMNGRLAADPPTFEVSEGERVRLRFVNASSATMFHVRTAGHQFEISHADGQPVDPVTVDSFGFGPGERYDAIVTADNTGAWEIEAAPITGGEPAARGILQYDDSDPDRTPTGPGGEGRVLQYSDLRALEPLDGIGGSPDRTYNLVLSAGGDGYSWVIDGQAYPDAKPLRISEGEHVRLRLLNRSPVRHPMHLHGHFFQVGDAVKDTVVVPGHMGQVTIDFHADNPGNWLFHCHNLYHLEAGMARVIQYV